MPLSRAFTGATQRSSEQRFQGNYCRGLLQGMSLVSRAGEEVLGTMRGAGNCRDFKAEGWGLGAFLGGPQA